MKVVVVHDYVTQRGGAERVALDLLRTFPGSRLVTSCYRPETTFPEFADYPVETLWTQRIPAFRRDPRAAFPVLASAFDSHVIRDADVVICSSSGWSHRVRTRAPKIVYCHNPARWFYQSDDYLASLPPSLRRSFLASTQRLKRSDLAAARSAKVYLANSSAVAARVHAAYGVDPIVVPPARGLSPLGDHTPVPGVEPGFLMTVGRARGYKHTDLVGTAMARLPHERLVVVGGESHGAIDNVVGVGRVSDAQLRWLYANTSGLVAMSHEDFGLTPVEAQAFGVPAVLLRAGGYLESSVEGLTAVYVDDLTPAAVANGVRELRSHRWDAAAIRRHGSYYSPGAFTTRVRGVVEWVHTGAPTVPISSGTLEAHYDSA